MSKQAQCPMCKQVLYGLHDDTPDEMSFAKGCPKCKYPGLFEVKPTLDKRPLPWTLQERMKCHSQYQD